MVRAVTLALLAAVPSAAQVQLPLDPAYFTARPECDLWRLEMLAPDGAVQAFRSTRSELIDVRAGDRRFELRWRVPLGEDSMVVRVEIRRPDGGPRTLWQLTLDNRSPEWAPWWTELVIPGPGFAGQTDVINGHHRFAAPTERLSGHLWETQGLLLLTGERTLLIAAEDPEHVHKDWELEVGREFVLRIPPPGMGVRGASYRQPFPLVVEPVAGDWWQAAAVYREWARAQAWARPRTLTAAEEELRRVRLWLTAMHPLTKNLEDVPPRALQTAQAVGVPTGIHWYNWYRHPFMPELFPAREGFYDAARAAQAGGLAVMPYINVLHLIRGDWLDDWRTAAALPSEPPATGRIVDGLYQVQVGSWSMAPMCRGARRWVEYCAAQAQRLFAEGGFRAIYLDQGASPPRWPCYDPAHGHSVGGGSYWAEGTAAIPGRIKQLTGGQMAISGEGRFEGYLPHVDLDLTGYWTEPAQYVPFYEFVFGGGCASFASVQPDEPLASFVYKMGVRGLFGAAARVSTEVIDEPAKLAFLGEILGAQVTAGVMGSELIPPPALIGDPGETVLEGFITGKRTGPVTVTVPRVHLAAWRADDGRLDLLALNVAPDPVTACVNLGAWREGRRQGAWRLLDARGAQLVARDMTPGELSIDIPPRSVRIIRWEATP